MVGLSVVNKAKGWVIGLSILLILNVGFKIFGIINLTNIPGNIIFGAFYLVAGIIMLVNMIKISKSIFMVDDLEELI